MVLAPCCRVFFFFNDTATTEIYTLSLHDALPISPTHWPPRAVMGSGSRCRRGRRATEDRKSTRLNSSHGYISYAVFCLKKKKIQDTPSAHDDGHRLCTQQTYQRVVQNVVTQRYLS